MRVVTQMPAAALVVLALASIAIAGPAGDSPANTPGLNAAGVNSMHPSFVVLDEAGRPALRSGQPASAERTCGGCHDIEYINAHNGHWGERVKASCVQCHWEGGRLPTEAAALEADGRLRREAIRVSSPRDENCALCHGIVHPGNAGVAVPADFQVPATAGRDYGFTLLTGAIFSAQALSDSYLNLEAKATRTYPWDIHARRLVRCVDCHFAANDPRRKDLKHTHLDFLVQDPRRIQLSEFLRRPDHRLVAATCRSCHDPMTAHDFLPYKQRHLDLLECGACHIPHPMGPAARLIDETVVREDGSPVVTYRGMELNPAATLNTAFAVGYTPLLLWRPGSTGQSRLTPFNAVDHLFWASGTTDRAVPIEIVRRAYLESGHFSAAVVTALDADRDGVVSPPELRLDAAAGRELMATRLRLLGVTDPIILRTVELYPVQHGVLSGAQVQRDCSGCHARDSRVTGGLPLAHFSPAGGPPATSAAIRGGMPGNEVRIVAAGSGARIEARPPEGSGLYVFGSSRRTWIYRLGLGTFLAVVLSTLVHATIRLLSQRPARVHRTRRRVYRYSAYERIWHWLMALSILALMVTGLQVEFANARSLIPLPLAVMIHNFFAAVLVVNAFLSLFYHLAAGAIRQFLPPREDLARQVVEQARYYTQGMLLGQPHPNPRSAQRKLNPLQQLTYLALLNVLFPVQVVTGVLIWGASRWPQVATPLGGLSLVAPLHALGSWLFLAFFVLHLYLTTTGHTVFSHVRAMLSGYQELEPESSLETGGSNA